MRRGNRISLDEQRSRDMLWLMGRPEFLRFLFTVAEKAGIASAAYGSNLEIGRASCRERVYVLV